MIVLGGVFGMVYMQDRHYNDVIMYVIKFSEMQSNPIIDF